LAGDAGGDACDWYKVDLGTPWLAIPAAAIFDFFVSLRIWEVSLQHGSAERIDLDLPDHLESRLLKSESEAFDSREERSVRQLARTVLRICSIRTVHVSFSLTCLAANFTKSHLSLSRGSQ